MKIKQVLTEARKLIENEENWTTGYYARDKEGNEIDESSPLACKFCAIGALHRVIEREDDYEIVYSGAKEKLAKVAEDNHGLYIAQVNDSLGHKATLEMFDKAIEICKD